MESLINQLGSCAEKARNIMKSTPPYSKRDDIILAGIGNEYLMKQRFPAMKAHSAEDSIQKHHHYEARSDTYSPYVRVFPF